MGHLPFSPPPIKWAFVEAHPTKTFNCTSYNHNAESNRFGESFVALNPKPSALTIASISRVFLYIQCVRIVRVIIRDIRMLGTQQHARCTVLQHRIDGPRPEIASPKTQALKRKPEISKPRLVSGHTILQTPP